MSNPFSGLMLAPPFYRLQTELDVAEAPPTLGTKYVLLEAKNVRVVSLAVNCVWTVQPTPLEMHFTVDGIAWIVSQANPVSTTYYYPINRYAQNAGLVHVFITALAADGAFGPYLFEARDVKIEVEITAGTVSQLNAKCKWFKYD